VDVGGKTELALSTAYATLGIDPDHGKELWRCEGLATSQAGSSPVARDGIVYLTGATVGGKRTMMAVRTGGRGDVSRTHVAWTQKAGGGLASPLLVGEHVYFIAGPVWCLRADTGKIVYFERLYDAKQEYASPVAADGKIILFTRRHGAFVLAAGPKLEQLAHNDLGDTSDFSATPAISAGHLFVRSNTHLYCIGKKNAPTAWWPQFRGPEGAGIAPDDRPLPVKFGAAKNVMWKRSMPAGLSSPVIWGDRVVTSRHLYAFRS